MFCDFAGINTRYRVSHDVCEVLLRGRSINKLQNGIILLIFKI